MGVRRAEIPLLVAVFLDLLGFGMVISDFQLRAESLVPRGVPPGPVIGVLLASTFVLQLLVSPVWGRWSDRRGRKPFVVACTLLSSAAMIAYGIADNLGWLLLSRVLAGFGSANVVIAQAWISDTTEGSARTAALGRISAAISAGLVLGPPIGGELARIGENRLIGFAAGGASLFGAIWLALALQGAPPKEPSSSTKRALRVSILRQLPKLRPLVLIATIAWFSLAMLEGTFARLLHRMLGFDQTVFGRLFGYEALVGILVAGHGLAWLAPRYKDRPLLQGAYAAQGIGLALNPLAAPLASIVHPMVTLVVASSLFAAGAGVANPTINALCSRLTPDERQGELFGLLQGTRAIGFVLGPILGGWLFDSQPSAPYFLAGAVCLFAALLVPRME